MGKKTIKTTNEDVKDVKNKKKVEEKKEAKKEIVPKVRGKKWQTAKKKVKKGKLYPLDEAIKLAKDTSFSSFVGSLEAHIMTKVGAINMHVALPHSTGKERRVVVATDQVVENIKAGKIEFEVLLASPKIMPKLVPFARILGPKGLMPNPKNNTLIDDPEKMAKSFSGNKIKIKSEKKAPVIHIALGKLSQPEKELAANMQAVLKALDDKKIQSVFLKATMGPAIKIKLA